MKFGCKLEPILFSKRKGRIRVITHHKGNRMNRKENILHKVTTAVCALCAVFTLIAMILTHQYSRIPLAAVTVLLVLLPATLERLCGCRLSVPLFLFCLLYALGPMFGQCWNLYYTVTWWDKLLHISGGVLFAIVGMCLYQRLEPESKKPYMAAVFGLLFSVAVAVVWEFAEFAADCCLGMDMQDDILITGIRSYMLGDAVGQTGSIENITSVIVNGQALPGYIDIGLIDTMLDLLLESTGAAVTCLLMGGRQPITWETGKRREKRHA